jgi:hypothetical protein
MPWCWRSTVSRAIGKCQSKTSTTWWGGRTDREVNLDPDDAVDRRAQACPECRGDLRAQASDLSPRAVSRSMHLFGGSLQRVLPCSSAGIWSRPAPCSFGLHIRHQAVFFNERPRKWPNGAILLVSAIFSRFFDTTPMTRLWYLIGICYYPLRGQGLCCARDETVASKPRRAGLVNQYMVLPSTLLAVCFPLVLFVCQFFSPPMCCVAAVFAFHHDGD